MKKSLLLFALIAACSSTMAFACPQQGGFPPPPPGAFRPCCHKPHCAPKPPKFNIEEKLNLTDEQKAQAKQLRMDTRKQMQPIMEAIQTKYEQKEIIKRNRKLTAKAQCEEVEKLNKEINELKRQAHDLRVKNAKDFEALLTPEQKAELKKIKEQARKDRAERFKKVEAKK